MAIKSRYRKRDGRTVYDVRLHVESGGWYTKTWDTKREAERDERDHLTAKDEGVSLAGRDPKRTFAAVAEEWQVSNPNKAGSTLGKDRSTLKNHILPTFGRRPVMSITRPEVQKLVTSWCVKAKDPGKPAGEDNRHNPTDVCRWFGIMQAVFTYAEKNKYISRDQRPCEDVNLPDSQPRATQIPTVGEGRDRALDKDLIERLAVKLGPHAAMLYLGLNGLRLGTVTGQNIGDWSFDRSKADEVRYPTVTIVRQQTKDESGRMILKPALKSERGRGPRVVATWLADMVYDSLVARGVDPMDPANANLPVFVTPDGARIHHDNWRIRVWNPAVKDLGLTLSFHDLKHIASQILDSGGVSEKVREHRLGTSAGVIKDSYLTVVDSDDFRAAMITSDAIRPPSLSTGPEPEPEPTGNVFPLRRAGKG